MQSVRTYKDHLPQSCVKCLQDKEGVMGQRKIKKCEEKKKEFAVFAEC